MKNPQTAVLPDDPRYKIFQSMPPIIVSQADLAKVAKVESPRVYRIVATGASGRVKKKITAIIDTERVARQPADDQPGVGEGGGRAPVLARGIGTQHGAHHLRHRRRRVLGQVRLPRGGLSHPHAARPDGDGGPAGEAPLLQRQMDAVREGLAQVSGEVTPYLAVPGDQLSLRVLELPFSDSRKIDQVVGYELEGQIVHAIEDVVFDHLVVGQRPEGATVMAAAARREDLARARRGGRGAWHPPARAVRRAADLSDAAAARRRGGTARRRPCQAVLDFGHHARTSASCAPAIRSTRARSGAAASS